MSSNFNIIEYSELEKDPESMEDVVGLDGLKNLVIEISEVNRRKEEAKNTGLSTVRGIIFNGPPGTGKTLVAKSVAKKLKYDFMPVSPSQLLSPLPAITLKKIQQCFDTAINSEKDIVIFIDEIDGIIKDRATGGSDSGGALQKFLEVLDGTGNKDRKYHIIVIVATNHIENLDSAFVRPGRFDEKVYFGLPGIVEREEFLFKALPNISNIEFLIDLTDGFSYAELKALTNRAKTSAFVNGSEINDFVLIMAAQTVLSGSSSNVVASNQLLSLHIIPHMTGHTLAYLFNPEDFTMGSIAETAKLTCHPNLTKQRIKTRKTLLINAISIIWAKLLEIEITGDSSSLSLDDFDKLDTIIEQLLILFGGAQYGNLNPYKMKVNLKNILTQYVNSINKNKILQDFKQAIIDHYTQKRVLTRNDLKNIMANNKINKALVNNLYNGLLKLIIDKMKFSKNEI